MKCRFVFNKNGGVRGVGRCQPHGQESCNESKEEQGRQQHVQTECGVEIKFVGQPNNEPSSSAQLSSLGCVFSYLRINS